MKAVKETFEPKQKKWQFPIDTNKYNRSPYLTKSEKEEIKLLVAKTSSWRSNSRKIMERLLHPLDDVLNVINPSKTSRPSTIRVILKEMNKRQTAFWNWKEEVWVEIVGYPHDVFQKKYNTHSGVQSNVVAIAYLLFRFNLHRANGCSFPPYTLAAKVFSKKSIQLACEEITKGYSSLGYTKKSQQKQLRTAISDLLLANSSPYLEDLTFDILEKLRKNAGSPLYLKKELVSISVVLMNMEIISKSLYFESTKGRRFGVEKAEKNVHPEWTKWCQRWHDTSTLSPQTRERTYYDAIKTGRWLADKHPEITSPAQWTRQLAIKFVADVDKMKIGDYVENINRACDKKGKPLTPVTKSGFLSGVRRFFRDCQEWEWIPRKFSPERALATPRSITALIKPNPRVIADDIWAKLLWAGLNLTEEDLPLTALSRDYIYPLSMVQAITITWLFAGIRNNEIIRLRTGCIRWQKDDIVIPGFNQVIPKDAVCYLEIPVNKTSPGYVKPVDKVLGEAILNWEKERPIQQPLVDRKDGSLADFLFMYRGKRIGQGLINDSIIPILCKKAGIPKKDVKGNITSHRARSTIATQLSTSKDPMTLFELKEWLGHSDVNSTINYTKITPTKLAKSYQNAEYFKRNLRTVEVLIDQDAISSGAATDGEPWKYYDLGHGLCTYDFFSQCKHRMACAGCGFYIPKGSSKAQIIEAKDNLERMLQEIPLTEEEEFAVTEGIEALAKLKEKLADVPTPDGKTPKQIEEEKESA